MRCDMESLINKITLNKLNKQIEVDFAILGSLPDCKRINTRDYVKVIDAENAEVEATLAYNRYNKPANMLDCDNENCVNTGALAVGAATNYMVYKLPYDATKFANGIVTLYVTGFTGAKDVTVKIASADTFAAADVYTVSAVGVAGEWTPVLIDLSQTPTSVAGAGWTPSAVGAFIAVNVADANASISSIAIFDSIEDFETNEVVKVGCPTELSQDDEIDAAEASCNDPSYDTSSISIERTITGTKVTENYTSLDPYIGKGEATTGFEKFSKTMDVVAGTDANAGYGVITLADADQDECGYIMVAADCLILKRYNVPVRVTLDEEHFIVIPNADGSTSILVNSNLVGKEVTVSYPRKRNVTELVANEANIGTKRVKMYVPFTLSNGKKGAKEYRNVLVTSFTDTINEDDTEFSFTLTIRPDSEGHLYHIRYFE